MSAAASARRTGQPVRCNSYRVGEREHLIWNPLGETRPKAKRFRNAVILAARRFDHTTKQPGEHWGALGPNGVKVLETLLYDFCNLMTGRLDPSIDAIMREAKLARATVVRALARLRKHHFLDWLRRSEPVESDGAGPQEHQATNAYWLALRGRAAGLVRLILGGAPPGARTKEAVQTAAAAERRARLGAMRQGRPGLRAEDVVSPEVKALWAEVRERRSASSAASLNPGVKGVK